MTPVPKETASIRDKLLALKSLFISTQQVVVLDRYQTVPSDGIRIMLITSPVATSYACGQSSIFHLLVGTGMFRNHDCESGAGPS